MHIEGLYEFEATTKISMGYATRYRGIGQYYPRIKWTSRN